MRDVWPGITNISVHLAHDANVLIAIQQGILVVSLDRRATGIGVGCFIGLETGVGEDDNEPLGMLIARRDGNMLLGYQLRQGGRREGLCS